MNDNGKYFFTIGSFEKNGFQNGILKDSEYVGRFKTENKYLGVLDMFGIYVYTKKTFKYETDLAFFDTYKDYIIGDVFLIKDCDILKELDKLKNLNINYSLKEKITVINQETGEEIECFTYFKNCNDLEEEIEVAKSVVNEYTTEEKIKALEVIIKLNSLKGKDKMSEWFVKLQKLKDEGQDLSKLLEN